MTTQRTRFIFACIAALAFCGGCASSHPSRFYLLHPLAAPETGGQKPPAHGSLTLGIGPVLVAKYLDRPQIAVRVSDNEIYLSEFHRWAEPLENNLTRVLAENLSLQLGTEHIEIFPWKSSSPIDYQVRVMIAQFDGKPGGQAVLKARWTVFAKKGEAPALDKMTTITEPVESRKYEALVRAQNSALEQLSREIAAAITGLEQ
jgi:hypothetical protein